MGLLHSFAVISQNCDNKSTWEWILNTAVIDPLLTLWCAIWDVVKEVLLLTVHIKSAVQVLTIMTLVMLFPVFIYCAIKLFVIQIWANWGKQ